MIHRELLVEDFLFTCAHCAHAWTVEYDVQHVEDGHGHECDYFFRNHHPSADPTGPQTVTCPRCQSAQVRARLTAQRVVSPDGAESPGEETDRGLPSPLA